MKSTEIQFNRNQFKWAVDFPKQQWANEVKREVENNWNCLVAKSNVCNWESSEENAYSSIDLLNTNIAWPNNDCCNTSKWNFKGLLF